MIHRFINTQTNKHAHTLTRLVSHSFPSIHHSLIDSHFNYVDPDSVSLLHWQQNQRRPAVCLSHCEDDTSVSLQRNWSRIHFDVTLPQRKGQNNKCRPNWWVGRGARGVQCWFLDECSPKGIMNSYSQARPKRKTAWVLFPWKGWSKSADEPGSFFPLILHTHHSLLSLSLKHRLISSHTHTHHVWKNAKKYSKLSVFHTSAYASPPPHLHQLKTPQ